MTVYVRPLVLVLAIAGLCLGTTPAGSESMEGKNNPVTFDGVLWARYSYWLQDVSESDANKDAHGFAIDRVYLTFMSELSDRISGRARIEARNLNDASSDIFLKTADIVVSDPLGLEGSKLRFGQTEGLISSWYERPWGYRVVEKTPTDLYLGNSTTWLGVGLAGSWLDGVLETDALIANHVPYNEDADGRDFKYKTLGARAYVRPITDGPAEGLGFGGYAQYAPETRPADENRALWFGAHAFFEGQKFNAGLQYDSRNEKFGPDDDDDVTARVISALARYFVTERTELFGRVDMVDYNTDTDDVIVFSPGDFDVDEWFLAETSVFLGLSHAYSNSIRSIIDLRFRTIQDDLILRREGQPDVTADPDNDIVISARLDARL